MAGAQARAVPAAGDRGRRRAPLARVLADLRPRSAPDGCISITPKLVDGGKVSPFLFKRVRPGTIVRLGGVEGTFVLPDPLPRRLLFISAGSGITPIMSMLRAIARAGKLQDVVHVHCARTEEEVIFGRELRELAAAHPGLPAARAPDRRAGPPDRRAAGRAVPRLARA